MLTVHDLRLGTLAGQKQNPVGPIGNPLRTCGVYIESKELYEHGEAKTRERLHHLRSPTHTT